MKYAIYIITHGRADKQITLNTLLKCGYKGDWYLLCDDEDEQLDKYKELYGDRVVVFSKDDYIDKVDFLTNNVKRTSTIFVRNAVYDVAMKMGYEYFGMFDDDISDFSWRYVDGEHLKQKKVEDITLYFDAVVEYMKDASLAAVGVASAGQMVGGVETFLQKRWYYNICQSFFCNVHKRMTFDGILAPDLNAVIRAGREGKVLIEPLFMQHTSPDRGSKSGGLKDLYDASNEYVWNFYPVIYSPSNVSIYIKNGAFRTKKNHINMEPRILSERYRK